MKYILDTNIFNRIQDGRFELSSLPNATGFVATLVQVRELEATRDEKRRASLLATFREIAPELKPAAFSWDIPGAGWDEGEWNTDPRIEMLPGCCPNHILNSGI